MQVGIPCVLMRGGTSKGAYFLAADLPADPAARDAVLMRVMGSPDPRQIDGLGGADPLTSKVAIVGRSTRPGIDVDYLFAQVPVDGQVVSYAQNCGNILAGVAPFAIERGLVAATDPTTDVVVFMENSGQTVTATIETPGGMPTYEGAAELAGVPGGAAPIALAFDDAAGSMCGALLPTGRALDEVQGIRVTCIDNGMPIVVLRASDLDRTGYEDRDVLDADGELKARLEAIRLETGPRMNLGDVEDKSVPKMTLVAPPRAGGIISTRSFIPHRCHASIGVFAALSVASACLFPESPAHALARIPQGRRKRMAVEHPSGSTEVICEVEDAPGGIAIRRGALVRTARKLFAGEVFVPRAIFEGRRAAVSS